MSVTPRPHAAPSGPPSPMSVGGYQLLTRLGEGGMGVVHLARSPHGERVALKVIRPNVVGDDESRARLAREVNSLSRVRSRRVAEVIDADPWGPVPFVATRYVPGFSLHDHVAEEGPLGEDDLVWFARCLAEAMDAVHSAGVLHRDIKPSNVLMEGRSPVLIDFGLARVADDPRLTAQGWLLGTPGYLAPEILHGEDASPAADVHAWAATVAFAGTGRAPFGRGPSVAVMDRVRRGEHDLSGLPEDIREVVTAGLDPEPRNRPTVAALHAWLDFDDVVLTVPASVGAATLVQPDVPFWEPLPETRPYEDEVPVPGWDGPAQEPVTRALPSQQSLRVVHDDRTTDPFADPIAAPFAQDDELAEDALVVPLPPPPAGMAERFRRTTLTVALGTGVAAAAALAPYLTLAALLALVWLTRTGSLGSSALDRRRESRGAKWYDGVERVVSSPFHLLAAVPGTLVLGLWAAGLATVVALLCFAAHVDVVTSLGLVGAAFAVGCWVGPGAGRFRRPVRRVVRPVAARGWLWLFALVGLGAGVYALLLAAQAGPVDWAPASQAPWLYR